MRVTPLLRQPTLPARGKCCSGIFIVFLGCRKPCLRLWISSLTDEAIAKGMENLRPCSLFDNLFLAADSRNKADWLLGVNSSYAVCKAVGFGNNSLGRVQTPCIGSDKRTVTGKGKITFPQTAGPYSSASARTGR